MFYKGLIIFHWRYFAVGWP